LLSGNGDLAVPPVSDGTGPETGTEPPRSRFGHYRTTAVLLLSQGLVAGVALLVNLVSARTMGPAGRGTIALALQLSYLVTIVVIAGVDRPYVSLRDRPWADALRELRSLIARPAVAVLTASVVALGVAVVTASPIAGLLAVSGAFVLGNAALQLTRTAYVVSRNDGAYALVTALTQGALGIGALLAMVVDLDNPTTWLGLYALSCVPAVAMLFFPRRQLEPDTDGVRAEVRRAGWVMLPATLGNTAMLRSDRLILPALGGTRELGLYVAVATVMELAAWPTQALVDSKLRQWTTRADTAALPVVGPLVKAALATAAIAAVLGFGLHRYVVTLFGPEFADARRVVVPLAIASVLYAGTRVLQGVLVARRRHRLVSGMELSGMAASVAFYFLLIPSLGGFGAAVGSALGYAVAMLVGSWLVSRADGGKK
jgi:O-antigen/teichoic acid export membrane protein